jgi:hypothetical protein
MIRSYCMERTNGCKAFSGQAECCYILSCAYVHAIMLCMCDKLSVCVKFAYVDAICNILCCTDYGISSFSDSHLCVRNFFCVWNFFMHAIHCIVGRENDVICPIVSIVLIGLVICDYVRGIPTLGQSHRHMQFWHTTPLPTTPTADVKNMTVLHVLNGVWNASYSDIQSERPLQSMMVTSLPPTEPSHNVIYCMHHKFFTHMNTMIARTWGWLLKIITLSYALQK